jgi:hypothetical protein
MQQHAQTAHRKTKIKKTRAAQGLLCCQLRRLPPCATRTRAIVIAKIRA